MRFSFDFPIYFEDKCAFRFLEIWGNDVISSYPDKFANIVFLEFKKKLRSEKFQISIHYFF
ncbi:hypothetical protein EG338_10460 [Kaistella haifensis]|nr:hypothetical protein EG338_10460 [Kaistella haifensis]